MIEKKLLKWSLIVSFTFLGLALLGIVLYLLIPTIISALTGAEVGANCEYPYPSLLVPADVPPVQGAVVELCNASQMLLATTSMILIILTPLAGLVPMALVSFDIFDSKTMSSRRKILWLTVMWMLLVFFAAAAYYFIERKD